MRPDEFHNRCRGTTPLVRLYPLRTMKLDSMTPDQLDQQIARYVSGEATPEEAERLEAFMAADRALAEQVDAMRRAWRAAGSSRSPWDSSAAWKKVRARLVVQPTTEEVPARLSADGSRRSVAHPAPARNGARWLTRAAAVLLIVTGGGWGITEWMSRTAAPEPLHVVATDRAQVGNVTLDDGSRVQLGVETTIRFASSMGRGSRDVYLDGNAYFEVVHNPERPFRVHTAHGVTEVLGTSFGVRAYAADSATTVVVAEGRVRLESTADAEHSASVGESRAVPARSAAVLDPGDLGRVGARGEIEKQRGVSVDRHLAWRERRLVFTDAPLRDVADEIARWYDLEVTIQSTSLERRRISATFGHDPIDQVLDHIEIALGVRIDRDGRLVQFRAP